jgi:hypothetical protein
MGGGMNNDARSEYHRSNNMSRVCARCWWYFKVGDHEGYCTNKPPVVVMVDGKLASVRPTVDGGEWCARWHDRGQDPGVMKFPSKRGSR